MLSRNDYHYNSTESNTGISSSGRKYSRPNNGVLSPQQGNPKGIFGRSAVQDLRAGSSLSRSCDNQRNGNATYQPQFQNTERENTLGLMALPKRRNVSLDSSDNYKENITQHSQFDGRSPTTRNAGESGEEKICILTGTVERVIKYGKIFQNYFCYFQVFGSVISIADGTVQFERKMLLRDMKGPILQLTYYSNATYINIENFHLGQNLRAVGRMVGPNIMSAITIRAATDEEIDILPRMCHISDYAVSTLCGDKTKT